MDDLFLAAFRPRRAEVGLGASVQGSDLRITPAGALGISADDPTSTALNMEFVALGQSP